jgi:hypothetical protein
MAQKTPEARLWAIIRDLLPPDVLARRIEDASGNLGTPDLFLARSGQCAWVELKAAGPHAQLVLRPGQQATMTALHQHGVRCAYLVGFDRGPVRLVGPLTDGKDWREHLIARWPSPSSSQMTNFLSLIGM